MSTVQSSSSKVTVLLGGRTATGICVPPAVHATIA
ncbi:MAG: hypothetical protein QOD69_1026 [Solirubrobacteraceae bacterium]|jgi:hypothetical protein|nr:hypothetical protein [Solirubrobacteraceae bacterium]